MAGRLMEKVCMITGAASGIGRATAERFAREDARLVLTDLNADRVHGLAKALEEQGFEATALPLDVTVRQQTEAAVVHASERYGRLDVLVNSAGITRRNVPADADFETAWDQVMDVNLKGTVLMCHAAVEAMSATGGGAIVNLGSIMSLVVYDHHLGLSDGFNPYPHSKGAIVQLTRDLGVRFAKQGIRVNAVCPGFVYTPLTAGIAADAELHGKIQARCPMGRLGEPEEIANVILFLASDESSFVTAAAWTVDGGYTAC